MTMSRFGSATIALQCRRAMPLSIERIASRARFNGRPIADLAEPPSAYLRRQIRVASFGFERPAQLARQAGDIFMFGSDYPHPEGLAHPVDDFRTSTGIEPATDDALYRANAAWLAGI